MPFDPNTSLVKPIEPMGPLQWLKEYFGPNLDYDPQNFPPGTSIDQIRGQISKRAAIETYGIDGLDITTNELTTVDGEVVPYNGDIELRGLFFSFLGLPSRVRRTVLPAGNIMYTISTMDMVRQFLGWTNTGPGEKKIWDYILFIAKAIFLLPIKFILAPIKLALNLIVKSGTECLLSNLLYFSGAVLSVSYRNLSTTWNAQNWRNSPGEFGLLIFWGAATGFLGLIHYISKICLLISRAILSPAKSAQIAWSVGRALRVGVGRYSRVIGTILGLVLSTLSIATTAAAIVVTLSFQSLALIHTLTWLVYTFPAPAIKAIVDFTVHIIILAGLYSLKSFGFMMLVTPVLVIANLAIDALSNYWYRLKNGGPVTDARNFVQGVIAKRAQYQQELTNAKVSLLTAQVAGNNKIPRDVAKHIGEYVEYNQTKKENADLSDLDVKRNTRKVKESVAIVYDKIQDLNHNFVLLDVAARRFEENDLDSFKQPSDSLREDASLLKATEKGKEDEVELDEYRY